MSEQFIREPALKEHEYTDELRAFEAGVWEMEDGWNGDKWGYTWEFATTDEDFEKKNQILMASTWRLDRGQWRTMRCSCCGDVTKGEPGIHVDIEHHKDHQEEQKDFKMRLWMLNKLFKMSDNPTKAFVDVNLMEELLATLEVGSDLYRELSLAIDESKESIKNVKHIRKYL